MTRTIRRRTIICDSGTSMAADTNEPKSSFHNAVCLQTWWLVNAEKDYDGRRLAVAGYTYREQQALRLFSSAPILKRHDVFSLETADGICVIIKGLIDKARTELNGFSSEVFQHFLFGFPPYWEECAKKCTTDNLGLEKLSSRAGETAHTTASDQRSPFGFANKIVEVSHEGHERSNLEEKSSQRRIAMEKSRPKCGNGKSPNFHLPQKCEAAVGHPDGCTHDLHPSYSCPVVRNSGRGSSSRHPTVEKVEYAELRGACFDDGSAEFFTQVRLKGIPSTPSTAGAEFFTQVRLKGIPSTPSTAGTNGNTAQNNKEVRGDEVLQNITDHDIRSPVAPCPMSKTRRLMYMSKAQHNICNERSFSKELETSFTMKQDQGWGEVMIDSSKRMGVNKFRSASRSLRSTKNEGKSAAVGRAYVSEKVPMVSSESTTFRRSRSGRLLLPVLEFWRNQTAVYDADRRITEIKTGFDYENPRKGSRSEPSRKRR